MKRLKLSDGWNIMAHVDDNDHLSLYVTNEDKSRVLDLESGIMANGQFFIKFTTEHIEKIFMENFS